jgi:hypothetical protein
VTILEKLKAARSVYADPEQRCKGAHAKDPQGNAVDVNDLSACSWCAVGVLMRFGIDSRDVYSRVRRSASLVRLNDTGRFNKVLELLDEAIRTEENRESRT